MPVPVAVLSPQTLLLEACQSRLERSEFDLHLLPFQGRFQTAEVVIHRPRLVILDAACEGATPLVWIDRLKVALPDAKVMVYLRAIRAAECQSLLSMGAKALADVRVSGAELSTACRRMLRGDVYLSPRVAQALALCRIGQANPFQNLSPRELTVCDLVVEGVRATDIAKRLSVSAKTVNTYRYRIFEKLAVDSDVQLTRLAYRHGMKGVESMDERI